MASEIIPRESWSPFFNQFSKSLPSHNVEIEVESLDLGSQIEVEWLPLIGLTYDKHDDRLEVVTETLAHNISSPEKIYAYYDDHGLSQFEILDKDQRQHLVRLKQPLALPEPGNSLQAGADSGSETPSVNH